MNPSIATRTANIVIHGRQNGALDLDALRSANPTITQGLEAQLVLLASELDQGGTLTGWKVGMTSGAARNRMGPGFRPFGHILRERTLASGSTVPVAAVPGAGLEPELCFEFGQGISGPDVTAEEVRTVVAAVRPAFEIQQQRLPSDVPPGVSVADNLSHWGIVVGDATAWNGTAAETVVDLSNDGELVTSVGPGFEIDEPEESMAALCRILQQYGHGIRKGDLIITGAFCKLPISTAGQWSATFSTAGAVEMTFD